MITFPIEDTFPLSSETINEHMGFDFSLSGDWSACNRCGERLVSNEHAELHVGNCYTEEEAREIVKVDMIEKVSTILGISKVGTLKLFEGGDSRG